MRISQRATALLVLASLHANPQEPAAAQSALNMQEAVRHWVFDAMAPGNSAMRDRLRGQVEAMAGREDLQPTRRDPAACTALPDDPLELIAREAQKTSIVIIGESHSEPRDRHFVGQVLQVLRHQGFNVYAAETFTEGQLDQPGMSGGDGWYSNEPIFGRTVLLARGLGYRLVAYEQTNEQEKARAAAEPDESSINRRDHRYQSADDKADHVRVPGFGNSGQSRTTWRGCDRLEPRGPLHRAPQAHIPGRTSGMAASGCRPAAGDAPALRGTR